MVAHIVPLVLVQSQNVVGICWTTDKTANKSLEQGVLWEVHPDTHKEIEASPPIIVSSVYKKKGWYLAEVTRAHTHLKDTLVPLGVGLGVELGTQSYNPISSPDDIYGILAKLQTIIEQRKGELPEGSYTTHLFKSGKEKIRKKLGEEAIEVILSNNKQDTIYESADLVYHLMVMLINEDINPKEVFRELHNRYAK